MKASFFATAAYAGPRADGWPVAPGLCDRKLASQSLRRALDSCRRADDLGFDWISVSEHHYAPLMLTPNPLVMAGAVSQATSRARIALLGPLLPLANPVRVAEEVAMLDSLTAGPTMSPEVRGGQAPAWVSRSPQNSVPVASSWNTPVSQPCGTCGV